MDDDRFRAWLEDEGVSPVIAVILMVAITVVLAATVYVWVSGFATGQNSPEQASATAKGIDLNDDGDVEWIRLALTRGENAPYQQADVGFSATDPNGNALGEAHLCIAAINGGSGASDSTQGECGRHDADGDGSIDEPEETKRFFTDVEDRQWEVGQTLYVPCQGEGNHLLTIALRDSTILDTGVECDEMPADTT